MQSELCAAIHASQFFNDDGVVDVPEIRSAQLFGKNRAQQAHPARLFDHLEREDLVLVPVEHMRRNLGFGELADALAKLDLLRRVFKFHAGIGRARP